MKLDLLPVVILAGGLATRLRPLTASIPKSLVEIQGEPFVAHQLRLLQQKGIQKIVMCVGYLGEQIIAAIGDGKQFGLNIVYSFDGPQLLGTAGAIKQALPLLGEAFFVLYGDSYLPCDYLAAQNAFQQSQKRALMTVFCNTGQWDTSNVEYANGCILAYNKKNFTDRMRYIDYGLGLFNRDVFNQVPDHEPYDLALLYQNILAQQQLAAHEVSERFYEIGSFAGGEELAYYLASSPSRKRK
jgi:MurNAc alpha-1-phosphate uridylyltransferase